MLTVHSLYRHQLHGTICLHIFVVVPLCRSFYLNSSHIFSSPLSLLSNIIPYSPHTLFQFKSFFHFYFYFYLVCFLSLFDVIMFGAAELWWWGALANLRILFDWFMLDVRKFSFSCQLSVRVVNHGNALKQHAIELIVTQLTVSSGVWITTLRIWDFYRLKIRLLFPSWSRLPFWLRGLLTWVTQIPTDTGCDELNVNGKWPPITEIHYIKHIQLASFS